MFFRLTSYYPCVALVKVFQICVSHGSWNDQSVPLEEKAIVHSFLLQHASIMVCDPGDMALGMGLFIMVEPVYC